MLNVLKLCLFIAGFTILSSVDVEITFGVFFVALGIIIALYELPYENRKKGEMNMGVSWKHYLFIGCKYEYKDLEEKGLKFIEEPKVGELGVVSDHMNGAYVYVGIPHITVDRDDGFDGVLVQNIQILQHQEDKIVRLCEELGFEAKYAEVHLFTHFT